MVEAGTYATPKSVSFAAPGVVDHDVGRLHVAMHDVVLLRHVERVGDLRDDARDRT